MTVTSRWVRYPVAGTTEISSALAGERGKIRGTSSISDSFTINSSNNQIRVQFDGAGTAQQITLTSGTTLDPRFTARDIERKLQLLESEGNKFKYCNCEWSNYKSADGKGHLAIKSGTTGGSSAVALSAGDNDATTVLGFSSTTAEAGTTYHTGTSTANNAAYTGTVTSSGTYAGMFDEEYYLVISNSVLVEGSAGGGNTYAGTFTSGGDWNADSSLTYTITVATTNGEVMNAGTGAVPTFTVSTPGSVDDISQPQELLFSDTWYYVGTMGVKAKWSDAQFGNGDTFTVACTAAAAGAGAVGVAEYWYVSNRGDDAATATTTSTSYTSVGSKGVQVSFSDSGTLTAKDAWRIICRSPTPEAYGVTNINYGNVTVTTNSNVKVHQFEIMSGAKQLSNVKFSLYSHGTFSHHDAGDADTNFHFGTVGAGNRGELSGVADSGGEWYTSVAASDISQDKTGGATGNPTFLWASKDDLAVVATADSAETVGNDGLVADFVFTAIELGANETGSNSSIVYRCYFDYS